MKLIVLALLFGPSALLARPPEAIYRDGVIEFENFTVTIGTTDGIDNPSSTQISVATCTLQAIEFKGTPIEAFFEDGGFKSIDDYRNSFTKAGAIRKIIRLRRVINEMEDFPIAQAILRRRIAWLISFYQNLP